MCAGACEKSVAFHEVVGMGKGRAELEEPKAERVRSNGYHRGGQVVRRVGACLGKKLKVPCDVKSTARFNQ